MAEAPPSTAPAQGTPRGRDERQRVSPDGALDQRRPRKARFRHPLADSDKHAQSHKMLASPGRTQEATGQAGVDKATKQGPASPRRPVLRAVRGPQSLAEGARGESGAGGVVAGEVVSGWITKRLGCHRCCPLSRRSEDATGNP